MSTISKINPFIKARYEHGYRSGSEFARVIGISQGNLSRWERGKVASIYEGKSWDQFHKLYKALGWSKERALDTLNIVYTWAKDPSIEIVRPDWEVYANIIPFLGVNENAGDDVAEDAETDSIPTNTNPLKAWRHENHFSVEDAAKLMEISPIVLSDIEDGIIKPNAFCLRKIVDTCGLSFHQVSNIFIEKQKQAEESLPEPEPELGTEAEDTQSDNIVLPLPTYENVSEEYPTCCIDNRVNGRRILDIVYGKISLEEYREIERMFGIC